VQGKSRGEQMLHCGTPWKDGDATAVSSTLMT